MIQRLAIMVLALATLGAPAAAAEKNAAALKLGVDRPGEREFIRDDAHLLNDADRAKTQELANKLLSDKVVPVIVVTIDSMAARGGEGLSIETFARVLFDQWGIGQATINTRAWNRGILVLVSKGDRKAWIALGGGWAHEKDAVVQTIVTKQMIPRFKAGDYSAGLLAAVVALDAMARDVALPAGPTDWRGVTILIVFAALLVFTVVSLVRRGAGGWAWLLWGIVFGVLGYVIYTAMTSSRSGGGFSGGSFGGGSSGGGGAGGSW
jgi:uncharacterized protein